MEVLLLPSEHFFFLIVRYVCNVADAFLLIPFDVAVAAVDTAVTAAAGEVVIAAETGANTDGTGAGGDVVAAPVVPLDADEEQAACSFVIADEILSVRVLLFYLFMMTLSS
jgi:hypothetical protein